MTYAESQPDTFGGWVTVAKARTVRQDRGTLLFSDVPPQKQALVTWALARFSDKHVVFTPPHR